MNTTFLHISRQRDDRRRCQNSTSSEMATTGFRSQFAVVEEICKSAKRMANAFEEQNKQNAELIKQNGQALEEVRKLNQNLEDQQKQLEDQGKVTQRLLEQLIVQQRGSRRESDDGGKKPGKSVPCQQYIK